MNTGEKRKGMAVGYFSNIAVELWLEDKEDYSYPSPERQLMWRLDDLKDRLEELLTIGASYTSRYIFTENDIRYTLPEDLHDICMIERAIESAKEDLFNKYGSNVYDAEAASLPETADESAKMEDGYVQMTIIDMFIPKLLYQTKIALKGGRL